MLRGWKYFAIESGNQCFTASDAGSTYNTYKSSDKCPGGDQNIGGKWAMDVYEIVDCENDNCKYYQYNNYICLLHPKFNLICINLRGPGVTDLGMVKIKFSIVLGRGEPHLSDPFYLIKKY